MIFACSMCGGVIELAAATGGVLGLSAMLTQFWNRRMKFRTLFSDMRKRLAAGVATCEAGCQAAQQNGLFAAAYGLESVSVTTAPRFPGEGDDVMEILSLDVPEFLRREDGSVPLERKPPKWLASALVIAAILSFFALMWAVDPHHGFVYHAVNDTAR